MRLLRPSLEPEQLDRFADDDSLSRKSTAETVLNIVSRVEDDLTLLLDSKWGTGKTVFATRLQATLQTTGIPCIYFDAFAHDLSDDAYGSMLGAMYAGIDEVLPAKKGDTVRGRLTKAAGAVGQALFSTGSRIAVNALTAGLLSSEDVQKIVGDQATSASIAKTIDEIGDDLTRKSIEKRVTGHRDALAAIEELRSALTAAATKSANEMAKRIDPALFKNPRSKLVVLIDELDRCRPSFALQILEVMKHLLTTKNVVFMLLADVSQLENTIEHIYGARIDSRKYLERFYDLAFEFPEDDAFRNHPAARYLNLLIASLPADGEGGSWNQAVAYSLSPYAAVFDFSLRTVDKIFNKLSMIAAQSKKTNFRDPDLIAALLVLERVDPSMIAKIRAGTATREAVTNALRIAEWKKNDEHSPEYVHAALEIALNPDRQEYSPRAQELENYYRRFGIKNGSVLKHLSDRFFTRFYPPVQSPEG